MYKLPNLTDTQIKPSVKTSFNYFDNNLRRSINAVFFVTMVKPANPLRHKCHEQLEIHNLPHGKYA